jgi:hypothetical protein
VSSGRSSAGRLPGLEEIKGRKMKGKKMEAWKMEGKKMEAWKTEGKKMEAWKTEEREGKKMEGENFVDSSLIYSLEFVCDVFI